MSIFVQIPATPKSSINRATILALLQYHFSFEYIKYISWTANTFSIGSSCLSRVNIQEHCKAAYRVFISGYCLEFATSDTDMWTSMITCTFWTLYVYERTTIAFYYPFIPTFCSYHFHMIFLEIFSLFISLFPILSVITEAREYNIR